MITAQRLDRILWTIGHEINKKVTMKTLTFLVTITFVLSGFSQAEQKKIAVERVAGPVARQLLEYDWQSETNAAVIPTNAVKEFKLWSNATLASSFALPETANISLHQRTMDTCDSIRTTYEKAGLSITILQTRMTLLIIVKGQETAVSDLKEADAVATRISQRVLGWPEDSSLIATHTDSGISLGERKIPLASVNNKEQVSPVGVGKGGFILDHWWSDGEEIGFFGVKEPFDNKSMFVIVGNMKSLPRNQRWF